MFRASRMMSAFVLPVLAICGTPPAAAQVPGPGLLPDLRTVVPQHLQIQNRQQREILRFSNGIANTGAGHWRMRPGFPTVPGAPLVQDAYQQILDASGNLVAEHLVSQFAFHPEHNHWHIDDVALFEVRSGSPTGPVFGANSIKTTFCLIDWYRLEGNSPNHERVYAECNAGFQGISPGWVDQYHQSTEGQQLDITGAPPGLYYLVSTANSDHEFLESDTSNNSAWVAFQLSRPSNGNPRLDFVGNSPCSAVPGLCGENAPNR